MKSKLAHRAAKQKNFVVHLRKQRQETSARFFNQDAQSSAHGVVKKSKRD